MKDDLEVRWKQRFQNFEKAYLHLKDAVEQLENPSGLEKEGTIHRFEFTHELSWKVMKDFLESKGLTGIIGSKDASRHAFQNELVEDGQTWMDMIKSRSETVHTYNESILNTEYNKIVNSYFDQITSEELKNHIERVGKVLFTKEENLYH